MPVHHVRSSDDRLVRGFARRHRGDGGTRRDSLLEVAAEVLVTRPTASLTEVARAAGIGRTTLHKQYATREDLIVAVAHRALDLLHEAVAETKPAGSATEPEVVTAAMRQLVTSLVPLGPELVFLLRQPTLDDEPEVVERSRALDPPVLALVHRGQQLGLLRADMPDYWFIATLYAQAYAAWEGVAEGWLAPRDAPDLVLRTLVEGLSDPAAHPYTHARDGCPKEEQ